MMISIVLLLIATSVLLASSICGCGGGVDPAPRTRPRRIGQAAAGRAELRDAWPFAVDRGTIACWPTATGPLLLFTSPGRRIYALDELAADRGYPAVEPIGDGFGLGVIVGDALELCPAS